MSTFINESNSSHPEKIWTEHVINTLTFPVYQLLMDYMFKCISANGVILHGSAYPELTINMTLLYLIDGVSFHELRTQFYFSNFKIPIYNKSNEFLDYRYKCPINSLGKNIKKLAKLVSGWNEFFIGWGFNQIRDLIRSDVMPKLIENNKNAFDVLSELKRVSASSSWKISLFNFLR